MSETVEIFEVGRSGNKVRIYKDDSTPSGKNWEYIDE